MQTFVEKGSLKKMKSFGTEYAFMHKIYQHRRIGMLSFDFKRPF
jgi:hypothetical protein